MNARVETIHVKPSFKQLAMRRRCLIVADSFYEWKQTPEGKIPQRIQLKNNGVFAFAGLWDKWASNQEEMFSCTMLTKDANTFMEPIHHRMPVIFNQTEGMNWLHQAFTSNESVQKYALNVSDPSLTAYSVSEHVNNARNNDASCIVPV